MGKVWNPEASVSRTSHGYAVLPENVVIIPELNGRMEQTDVTELAKDIEENGQLVPVVCWKNEEGWPVLAAGHRRYRAVTKINEKRKAADKICLQFLAIDAKSEAEAFDFTVRENFQRTGNTAMDHAHNCSVYRAKFGLTEEQIARKYYPGMTTDEEMAKAIREVKNWLQLLELSEDAQDELRNGFLTTSAALQLAAIPSRKKQDEVIKDAKKSGAKKLKVADAKAAKEEATGKPAKARKPISENTPVKLLERYKELADYAQSLACEVLGSEPNGDALFDLARSVLGRAYTLKVPLVAGFDRMAEELSPDYRGEA